ncbi:uncharacterized protein LOC143869994 [Tasmannia lanceolata]|uniref:uncharacterized protein LOC143869994 n=1 Tax=Tasmannia lanceolata TaxID=3420 RepID=UPI004062F8BE
MEKNKTEISARKSNDSSSSPEFEFWMLRNPNFPQPNLPSADELFSNGVLLPLPLLPQNSDPEKAELGSEPDPEPPPSVSKRWKDIFKMGEKKPPEPSRISHEAAEKRKKEKKSNNGVGSGDINLNIWPFSRSRSAGTGLSRPKSSAAVRKSSSAPCSRSNSGGESKMKKFPASPSRAGLHLGRSSPVRQVRRGGSGPKPNSEPLVRNSGSLRGSGGPRGGDKNSTTAPRVRVLNLSVPLCIGYRNQLSCNADGKRIPAGEISGTGKHNNGNSTSLFNIRTLFSKKVY